MTIADSGKVELTAPRSSGLRDLSDPVARKQIADEAQRDAQKSVLRLRRRMRLREGR